MEGVADFCWARGQCALLHEAQAPKVHCATMRSGVPVGRALINQEEYTRKETLWPGDIGLCRLGICNLNTGIRMGAR